MTRPDIETIRARADAAAPGEWKCWHKDMDFGGAVVFNIGDAMVIQKLSHRNIGPIFMKEDADFIAHARTDIPTLLDYIKELETERDAALTDLRIGWLCRACKKREVGKEWCSCKHREFVKGPEKTVTCSNFEWRGVQEA